jgi:hypothetical protein
MRRTPIKLLFLILIANIFLFSAALIFAQSGTWQKVNPNNTPTARHETSFVYAGGKFYLIGGRESQQVQIYNPSTNSWSNGATAPKTMHHIQPVVVNNLIYSVMAYSGGCCDGEFGLSNVYIYDPRLNKWITSSTIPSGRRRGSTGVVFYQGKFYSLGGLTGGHGNGSDGVSAKSYKWFDSWDPYQNKWSVLPDAPRARDHFGAAVVNGKLYAAGGRTSIGSGFFNKTIAEVDVFNFSTRTWSTLPSNANIPTKRAGTAVAVLGNELFVIGGEGNGTAYSKTEALNTSNNTWRTVASLNTARHGTTASVCNGMIYIAAGSPTQGGGKLNSMERYFKENATSCSSSAITGGQLTTSSNGSFGEVKVGQTLTRTITISNVGGNQGIVITGVGINNTSFTDADRSNGEFSVSSPYELPIVLDPDMTVDLTVSYTPKDTGSDTVALRIQNHMSDAPFEIALSGQGGAGAPSTNTPQPTSTSQATNTAQPTATQNAQTPTATTEVIETGTPDSGETTTPEATETASGETSTPGATVTGNAPTSTSENPTATVDASTATTQAPTNTSAAPTSTPQGAANLLLNGGFETEESWKAKLTNTGNDKRVVNKRNRPGKPDKIVSYAGEAAYQFVGVGGENSAIKQKVAGDISAINGTLTLSAWVKAKNITPDVVIVRVKIKTEMGKETLKLDILNTADFAYQPFTNTLNLTTAPTKIVAQIGIKGVGKFLIDEVSLTADSQAAVVLPLPAS